MSEKLVVEFYDLDDTNVPTACVLACHGGDNPVSAAITLTAFFMELAAIPQPRFGDAGLLAARFVVSESQKNLTESSIDFLDVAILPPNHAHGYQVARVYAAHGYQPRIEFVADRYSTDQEMKEATAIVRQYQKAAPSRTLAARA